MLVDKEQQYPPSTEGQSHLVNPNIGSEDNWYLWPLQLMMEDVYRKQELMY